MNGDELRRLKDEVCRANRALAEHGLAPLTWGNASGITADRRLVVIKPSGVPYAELVPDDLVVVAIDGAVVEGRLKPSSDTPTHLVLYRAFPHAFGIVHAHSPYAVMWAQARREIPCFGTTHADHFRGPVPLTRPLTAAEVAGDYERATGDLIVERFRGLDPRATPAVLVAGHAPFAWGESPTRALEQALALETVAWMAFGTTRIDPSAKPLEEFVLQKHFERKHGPRAYYGQRGLEEPN